MEFRRSSWVAPILVLLAGAAGAWASTPRDEARERVSAVLDAYAKDGVFSGVALVADAEGVLLEKGYGLADREWGIANAPEARYRIGSISKQFTAILVLSFAAEGRLDLDAPLNTVLPWYRADTGARVSVRQLLGHTSGLERQGVMRMITGRPGRPMPLREEVEEYCSGGFEFEPGSDFAYNNAGYLILSALVEELGGKPYADVLAERILEPLGLADTGLYDPGKLLPRRAKGYELVDGEVRPAPFVHATLASGAGGLYSTTRDLYRWDRALYSDALLPAELLGKAFTPGLGEYGYGWWISEEPVGPGGAPRVVIQHPGQGDGFWSTYWRVPGERRAVILIGNLGRPPLSEIASRVLLAIDGGHEGRR